MLQVIINFTQSDDRSSFNYYPSVSTGFFFFLQREVDKEQECERYLTSNVEIQMTRNNSEWNEEIKYRKEMLTRCRIKINFGFEKWDY